MNKLRKKMGWYNLRKEFAKWVAKRYGDDYVEEALKNYDNLNEGIPIGGYWKTVEFIEMVETCKREL